VSEPLLDVRDLSVTFPIQPRGAWPWTPPDMLQAVTGASFTLDEGETLGIVGESGSGKSTLARAIIGTVPSSSGAVLWEGTDLTRMSAEARRRHRAQLQMVFQDPLAALNPRMTVGSIIAEPLRTHRPDTPRNEVRRRVSAAMDRVGLLPNLAGRYPHEFSGGQCQRIGIARALILEPRLVVCDEPVSALDVSVQAQVINLLAELKREMGLSLIFIAHDIGVVRHISDRILVMYLGRLMERGPSREVTRSPAHPYTRALLASVPIPDPRAERARDRATLKGELPSPMNPPSGCVFRTRCPQARPDCADAPPPVVEASPRHKVACPYWDDPLPAREAAE
jgi:oligopeptide transport system ATP-binding protein